MSQKVRVLYPNRELAFVASAWEVAKLASKDCVRVEYSAKHTPEHQWGVPKGAVLTTTKRAAMAVLQMPTTRQPHQRVTRKPQEPGAPNWVQRADMAGRGAGTLPPQTIHFKLGFREATA